MGVEAVSGGCKVLPLCHASSIASSEAGSRDSFGKDRLPEVERRRVVSRMKVLLRWAAAAKASEAGSKGWKVLYFGSRVTLKEGKYEASSNNSTKLSFKWDVGSCSDSSSVYSAMSLPLQASRNDHLKHLSSREIGDKSEPCRPKSVNSVRSAHWVTTDADFVVLEL